MSETETLPSGDVVELKPVKKDGVVTEPEVFTVKKGPYKAHMVLYEHPSGAQVKPPFFVSQSRPAILSAEQYFNFDRAMKADSKANIRGAL